MNATFQFHKVRLKDNFEDKLKESILRFQFHKVRLKAWASGNDAAKTSFQFHKVRLKVQNQIKGN